MQQTTQGSYIATANGKLLGYMNHHDPEIVLNWIKESLDKFEPSDAERLLEESVDEENARDVPANGLIIRINGKVLDGYEEPENEYSKIFQDAISRDNLWVTSEEKAALIAGRFPDSLTRRICRFALVDGTRGEPPMWEPNELGEIAFSLDEQGLLTGKFAMQTANKKRGFKGEIFGFVEADDENVTRFDLVAKGTYWGQGRYTTHAPKGKFPIAMTFRLADGSDPADAVAPQGTKGWLINYYR